MCQQNQIVMNQAHLHLVLNHLPILGVLFGLLVLAGGYLMKNKAVSRTGLGLFIVAALCAVPAYFTGEGAEETVENLPGVAESLMERHEELAGIFLGVVGLLGVLSLATFLADLKSAKITPVLYAATFAAALGAMAFGQQVGSSGGEIRHTEIRSGAVAAGENAQAETGAAAENAAAETGAAASTEGAAAKGGKKGDDDDDD